jgi:hypothetical protein
MVSDTIIVVPPFSPSDTNPPLAPAMLRECATRRGIDLEVVDLNALFMLGTPVDRQTGKRGGEAIGDQGKDRAFLADTRAAYRERTEVGKRPTEALPAYADPILGMHYSFETISESIDYSIAQRSWWRRFVGEFLIDAHSEPIVLGISVMGPSQVFAALVVAALVSEAWPAALIVMGGSHVSLLREEIERDGRYSASAPGVIFMYGHCEEDFISLVTDRRGDLYYDPKDSMRRHSACGGAIMLGRGEPEFSYLPEFPADWLSLYPHEDLVLPVQFTRGCSYGRCTFCTYPIVEPVATRLFPEQAADAMAELCSLHKPTGLSLKDSLVTVGMLEGLADAVSKRQLEVAWSATTKLSKALVPLTERLAEAGLRTVEFGLESISPGSQELYIKRQDPGAARRIVQAFASAGISVVVNLMFGAPGETIDVWRSQLQWAHDLRSSCGGSGRVTFSAGLLEIERGSPLAATIRTQGIAPWAQSYRWERPEVPPAILADIAALNGSTDETA